MESAPQSLRAWSWKQGDARLSVEIREARLVWTEVTYDRGRDRFHTTSDHQHVGDFVEYGPMHAAPSDVIDHLVRRLGAAWSSVESPRTPLRGDPAIVVVSR